MFWNRRPNGVVQLDAYAACRADLLHNLLMSEVNRAAEEASSKDRPELHPQCVLDFDRADYTIGERHFACGAVAKSDGKVETVLPEFEECLSKACGSDAVLTYVVSALTCQISMAHLASACYSGPHMYAVPSGCTTPHYEVKKSAETNSIFVQVDRVSKGFGHFTIGGEDPLECHKDSSINQSVRLRVALDPKLEHGVSLEVLDAWEAMSMIHPNQTYMVNKGLELHFRSPPSDLSTSRQLVSIVVKAAGAIVCMAGIHKLAMWPMQFAFAVAATFVATVAKFNPCSRRSKVA